MIEEGYSQSVELRSIDASHEILPVFGNPLNVNKVRTETTERDRRGGYYLLTNMEMAVNITPGDMYPESGMS